MGDERRGKIVSVFVTLAYLTVVAYYNNYNIITLLVPT